MIEQQTLNEFKRLVANVAPFMLFSNYSPEFSKASQELGAFVDAQGWSDEVYEPLYEQAYNEWLDA